jgi:hypothetical protein
VRPGLGAGWLVAFRAVQGAASLLNPPAMLIIAVTFPVLLLTACHARPAVPARTLAPKTVRLNDMPPRHAE